MRNLIPNPPLVLSTSQRRLAEELKIPGAHALGASELVSAIESQLGERATLECARWFVMSVLRHEQQADWSDPDTSGMTRERQYQLAALCLEAPDFAQSIKTVLKGDTCKYVLVGFRRTRNTRKHILANTTVAYDCARRLLHEANLLPNPAPVPADLPGRKLLRHTPTVAATTANRRRASRRGFADTSDSPNTQDELPDAAFTRSAADTSLAPAPATTPATGLTSQEYAELEQALSQRTPVESSKPAWQGLANEEARSWLWGLLAGFAVFAVVLVVFF